jgi:flagellin
MSLSLVTNTASLGAQRSLSISQGKMEHSLRNLASGLRVNSAADDAAGLAISEKLHATSRSMRMAQRNASDAMSLVQTAEGAMSEISSMLIRARELAVQSATETTGIPERRFIEQEAQTLFREMDRIARVAEFNGKTLLDGTGNFQFQVGTDNTVYDRLRLSVDSMRAVDIGVSAVSLGTQADAQSALTLLDRSIEYVAGARAELGAMSNRLESTVANLDTTREKLTAARSRIVDTDVAQESANLTKHNILLQANISVLAQANQAPSIALSLLG